jgi:hypothetical protein
MVPKSVYSDTWTLPHLLQLKGDYDRLVNEKLCVAQETYTVKDPPAHPL